MKASLCWRSTSTLNFELPDLPSRKPCRNAMATSRLGPLSRMTSLQVYCSTVRCLLSCAHAGAPAPQPSTARTAAAITAALRVVLRSCSPSTAGGTAHQTDAPRAMSPEGDGAEGRRVTILADQNVAPDALDRRECRARP